MIGAVAAAAIVAAAPATAEIAFNHSGGIELMRSDGSGVVRITEPGAQTGDGEPAWSPDGSRLAFVRTFDRGGELGHLSHIRVLDAAGERPLTG